jgi:hypothetical protein
MQKQSACQGQAHTQCPCWAWPANEWQVKIFAVKESQSAAGQHTRHAQAARPAALTSRRSWWLGREAPHTNRMSDTHTYCDDCLVLAMVTRVIASAENGQPKALMGM